MKNLTFADEIRKTGVASDHIVVVNFELFEFSENSINSAISPYDTRSREYALAIRCVTP